MINDEASLPLSAQIATELLEIEAIKLQPRDPFTWASGWKSPIYCDNRMTLSYPKLRTLIKNAFVKEIKAKYPTTEIIAGVATAGIPQGALIADALGLPFIYVRDKAKSHGRTNRIEGQVQSGKKVFVIEDLISTGGSSIKAIEALREADMEVLGLGAIFTYGFPHADRNLMQAKVSHFSLSDYHSLLDIAVSSNLIKSDELESLNLWRMEPENWRG